MVAVKSARQRSRTVPVCRVDGVPVGGSISRPHTKLLVAAFMAGIVRQGCHRHTRPVTMNLTGDTTHSGLLNRTDHRHPFWTPQQLRVLESIPAEAAVALGVVLTVISVFGVAANCVILYVFSKFKGLRTSANVFVINLTIADLCSCLLHPLAAYSALAEGRWAFGQTGCNLYGMGVGFFGLNTIMSLSAIACERYAVITAQPINSTRRINRRQARTTCVGIWIYCAALAVPPWLLGWSRYEPEGILVTCSWDYTTRTLSNRLYYVYLLTFGFAVPVAVLTYCYATIMTFIVRHGREMNQLMIMTNTKRRKKADVRTAQIVLALSLLFFVAWTPYAIVSFIGQFGAADDEPLSPWATTVPALFAKTAVLLDPFVYGFSHPQLRKSLRHIVYSHVETSSTRRVNHPDTTVLTVRPYRNSTLRYNSVSRRRSSGSRDCSFSQQLQSTSTTLPKLKLNRPETICIHHFRGTKGKSPNGRGKKQRRHDVSVASAVNDETGVHQQSVTVFQEESEYHLFRSSNKSIGRLKKRLNTKRRKYHVSEPNLLRCWTDRVIPNAAYLTWAEYRRKKRRYMRATFFRSAENLKHHDFQHLMIHNLPAIDRRDRKTPSIKRDVEIEPLSVPDYEDKLNRKLMQLAALRSARWASHRSPSGSLQAAAVQTRKKEKRARPKLMHDDCCQCAYVTLSQTVTLAAVSGTSSDGPKKTKKEWRACMVSGREAVSSTFNSP